MNRRLLILALLVGSCFAQTTNTFPALQHFPGAPVNPCQKTFLAQNDSNDAMFTCDVNTLNWVQIGPSAAIGASGSTGFPIRFTYTFGRGDGILAYGHGVGAVGSQGNFSPTGTETSGRTVSSSATASANTVVSTCSGMGANPGQDFLSYGTITRFSIRIETQTTATARYWVGIMDLGAGECTAGNSTYASDTPNRNYCAFRFSTTTDTTWKAVCATSNVLQTVVDTGVVPATSASTMFEIFPQATQTLFFINGNLVATISTNNPVNSSPVSFGFQGDNKNTATAETVVFFWDQLFESK